VQDRSDQGRQHVRGSLTCSPDDGKIKYALAGIALLALVERGEAGGFEKALHGLLRRAFAGAAPLLRLIRLSFGEARHRERETAGRDECL